jgi:3-keto-disaccharide hydrolase
MNRRPCRLVAWEVWERKLSLAGGVATTAPSLLLVLLAACGSQGPDSSSRVSVGASSGSTPSNEGADGSIAGSSSSGSASAGPGGSGSGGSSGSASSSSGSSGGGSGIGSSSGTFAGGADAALDADAAGNSALSEGGTPLGDAGANLVSLFDGASLSGWIQVPPSSFTVTGGAMHSLGTARGFIYTSSTYGDFRFIFTSRLVQDPANHLPCVLFWGNAVGTDALAAIQIQPPRGYMWDYRTSGPTANKSPDMFETRLAQPGLAPTQWSQCEMLASQAAGTLRFACCGLTGTNTRCKGIEIVDFKDPTAGKKAPLALQVHNAGMIEEFKNLYVESPVADPTALITTQWP